MATIFYSREDVNQSKFIFDYIKRTDSEKLHKTIIIAPKQFTFQIERDAFCYMGNSAIMGIDVMGFQRFGNQVIKSVGGEVSKIGIAGRKMVISKIMKSRKNEFKAFKDVSNNEDFLQMICDGMAELKKQKVEPKDLAIILEKLEGKTTLSEKIKDLSIIFEEYTNYLEGKYLDGEDFINLYNSKIKDAKFIKSCNIWIYGFDIFDKKMIDTIVEIQKYAKSLNIMMTYDESKEEEELFKLGQENIKRLSDSISDCQTVKIEYVIKENKKEYEIAAKEGIRAIEKNLYRLPVKGNSDCSGVELFQCANQYYEAINAAAYIKKIVKEKGYRYREIAIINNEIDSMGEMYKRVFKDYGIELFLDEKKNLHKNTVMAYLREIIKGIRNGFGNENIMEILNLDFFKEKESEINDLEIYSKNYVFKKTEWEKDFIKGKTKYTKEELDKFNNIRNTYIEPLIDLKKSVEKEKKTKEKISIIWKFLEKDFDIRRKIKKLNAKEPDGNIDELESIQENAQVWNKVIDVLNQMIEILGDEDMENKEFCDILSSGLDTVEVGVIPPTSDCLILSDMRRMKKGITKATLIVNGTDGVLPLNIKESGIFTAKEIDELKERGVSLAVPVQKLMWEEKVDIYRNIAKTTESLYLSYAISNQSGEKLEPSFLIETVKDILPNLRTEKDWISTGKMSEVIGGREITKGQVIESIMAIVKGDTSIVSTDEFEFLKSLFKWYSKEKSQLVDLVDAAIRETEILSIPKDIAQKLYLNEKSKGLNLSPSRLELFGRCPFAHFMSYGIRPEIEKAYKVESSDLGSIYHYCMKIFVDKLFDKATTLELEKIKSKEDIYDEVDEILKGVYDEYNEGILKEGDEESYRKERIREVCVDSICEVVKQLKEEKLQNILCEVNFGKGKEIPEINVARKGENDDHEIYISGQIDRLDIDNLRQAKVVDYKSGNDKFILEEAESGIKLQLFLYLMAAAKYKMENLQEVTPKGAFYFGIKENLSDLDGVKNNYKLDGFIKKTGDEEINKDIYISGEKHIFESEEFDDMVEKIGYKVRDMAISIYEGNIKIEPKKVGMKESCQFCQYKGICKFDLSMDGCSYKVINNK